MPTPHERTFAPGELRDLVKARGWVSAARSSPTRGWATSHIIDTKPVALCGAKRPRGGVFLTTDYLDEKTTCKKCIAVLLRGLPLGEEPIP